MGEEYRTASMGALAYWRRTAMRQVDEIDEKDATIARLEAERDRLESSRDEAINSHRKFRDTALEATSEMVGRIQSLEASLAEKQRGKGRTSMDVRHDERARELATRARAQWGELAQIGILIEELGELVGALPRLSRDNRPESEEQVIEEAADVEIALHIVRLMYGDEAVDQVKGRKLSRLHDRIWEAEHGQD